MAFVWLVVVAYYLGDDGGASLLTESPMGLAIMGVYLRVTGSRAAATVLVLFHEVTMYISLYNCYVSVAWLAWTFSQNKGLPFSGFFVKVSSHFNQPFRTLGLLTVVDVALGPFRPRGVAIVTNILAVVYILYVLSFAGLPTVMPVTKDNMNYAGPMMLGLIVLALAGWCISDRKRFQLPDVHFDS
ncbi:hypothetical protein PG994_008515 [Apiospora phragmitis]|uniref:Uncharacterized protein n=1 Tax=Apiospora phragmitis TaxID=2905665 RepID=A0ABR1UGM6_9PEZI